MFNYLHYIREANFPHIWCPGCGNGIILKSLIRAIAELGLHRDEIVMVSGIGCSSRTPGYIDINTLHTTHGRALAFATGIKMGNPDLKVIVVTGDGDATAIGGNHYIHAARRNIDVTVLLYNNWIYGMTGGQCSPTTPHMKRASTAPYGNREPAFNITDLAEAAGASYVARGDVYHIKKLDRLVIQAIEKRGFSLLEIISPCPIAYGRRNKMGHPVTMMKWLKENAVPISRYERLNEEEREGKLGIGVLVDKDKKEFTEEYQKLINQLREK